MTRYRVLVTNELLGAADAWLQVEGFRLVSVDPEPGLPECVPMAPPGTTICTFEDDGAPPELEGQLVTPTITRLEEDGRARLVVTGRDLY